ncbi:MAG TPA: cupredoxin family copper-binding protein [Chloroflexota bacterium]|nr:cupredoxin family copper-binding protein [Chloroflexota bacterium]
MWRMIGRIVRPALGAACAAVLLASSLASADQQFEIHMRNNSYNPDSLTVPAGTMVRWVNDDGDVHTISQIGGGFDSGLVFTRDSWSYTFNDPGTYEFYCLPHPYMHGTITVE